MGFYRISNRTSGYIFGVYEGEDGAGALDAMARDAGYTDYAATCGAVGGDGNDMLVQEAVTVEQVTGQDRQGRRWWLYYAQEMVSGTLSEACARAAALVRVNGRSEFVREVLAAGSHEAETLVDSADAEVWWDDCGDKAWVLLHRRLREAAVRPKANTYPQTMRAARRRRRHSQA